MVLQIREARVEGDSSYAARQRERLLRRAAEEEELMMRVPLAKKELKGLRAVQHKAGFSGGAMLDDFADDVTDLVQVSFLLHVYPNLIFAYSGLTSISGLYFLPSISVQHGKRARTSYADRGFC